MILCAPRALFLFLDNTGNVLHKAQITKWELMKAPYHCIMGDWFLQSRQDITIWHQHVLQNVKMIACRELRKTALLMPIISFSVLVTPTRIHESSSACNYFLVQVVWNLRSSCVIEFSRLGLINCLMSCKKAAPSEVM